MYAVQIVPQERGGELQVAISLEPSGDVWEDNPCLRLMTDNQTGRALSVRWEASVLLDCRGKSHAISATPALLGTEGSPGRPPKDTYQGDAFVYVICLSEVPPGTGWVGTLLLGKPGDQSISVILAFEVDGRQVIQTYPFTVRAWGK